jgi:hypothetical protein
MKKSREKFRKNEGGGDVKEKKDAGLRKRRDRQCGAG